MTITVSGPDGSTVDFPDGTDQATIHGVMSQHFPAASEGLSATKVARSAATGVPLVGGMLNQAEAVANATLAPVLNPLFDEKNQLKGSWSERRAESLRQQQEMDRKMEEEHPVVDTLAKVAGGVAGTIPAMAAAPAAFGLTGTLPQMVARGAASNAALGAADAAIRGENPVTAAEVGGAMGAVAPLAGRAIGKGVQAVRDWRNPPALVPQATERVAGVDVPLTQGQATQNPVQQAEEEIMRRGGRGTSAEEIARKADQDAQAAIEQARGGIGASLDPIGSSARTAPQVAGEAVGTELSAQEQAQRAAAAAQASWVDAQGRTLARDIGGGAAPVTPFDAAESTGAAVARQREAAVNKTRAAYKARDEVAGEFDPSVPQGMAEDIRGRLNAGDNPIWVDPTNESTANKALKLIDQTVGKDSGLLANSAAPKPPPVVAAAKAAEDDTVAQLRTKFGDVVADAYAKQSAAKAAPAAAAPAAEATMPAITATEKPVDLKSMDEARKRLVTMFGDAKSAALRTGDRSDMRAMGKILHEFDNVIQDALDSGKFSGDAALAGRLQRDARAAHAEYRQTFSSRGPGDEIGRSVEKIIGRYADSAAAPDEVAAMSYGSRAEPGGGKAAKVALRLRTILGENSADWKRYKQGLFSYLAEAGPGEATRTPAQVADRLEKFLNGTKGNSLARVAFSSQERAGMQRYAQNLRSLEQPRGTANIRDDQLRRAVSRIAGSDGQTPASPGEVVDMLFSRSGKGDKGISVKLGAYLKQNLSKENWTAVRQGMWEKLTNAGEGKTEWGPQMLHQRLHEFLNESGKSLSKVMFTTAERTEIAKLASVYKRMAPLKGTTNPSGTAPMLAKIAKKASNNILTLIGLGAHGVTGAIAGHAIQRGAETIKDARAGRAAVEAFYGKQARAPVSTSRLPMLLAPAIPAANR